MLNEKQMLENNIEIPIFPPNLKIWTTNLNDKYLITGSIGCDPKLIEPENNFPRFTLIKKQEESEEILLEKVKNRGAELLKRIDEGISKEHNALQESPDEQSACFVTKNLVTKTDITVGKGKNESAVTGDASVKQEAKPEEVNNETPQAEIV